MEFKQENLNKVPESLGVFLLARGEGAVAYVGRSDVNLREEISSFLNKGYTHFSYVKVPWVKEGYEMQCRLYHHEGGKKRLDNNDHPWGPGNVHVCLVSSLPIGRCDF